MQSSQQTHNSYIQGLILSILSYLLWGFFPLYWKMLTQVPAEQILAHRIIWSFILLTLIVFFMRNKLVRGYLKNAKILGTLFITAIIIAINWGVYIYAVNYNQIVEASLGYYINPIVIVIFALLFLKERLNRLEIIAIAFALAGIVYLTIEVGRLPVISLVLATSFAIYALLRKKANLQSMAGLMIETMILAPLALGYLLFVDHNGTGAFGNISTSITVLLILAGPVTTLPLYLFGIAAPKIPLSTTGFIQYLSPSIQLVLGVVVYSEPFTHAELVSFTLVWIGLGFYTFSLIGNLRSKRAAT